MTSLFAVFRFPLPGWRWDLRPSQPGAPHSEVQAREYGPRGRSAQICILEIPVAEDVRVRFASCVQFGTKAGNAGLLFLEAVRRHASRGTNRYRPRTIA